MLRIEFLSFLELQEIVKFALACTETLYFVDPNRDFIYTDDMQVAHFLEQAEEAVKKPGFFLEQHLNLVLL